LSPPSCESSEGEIEEKHISRKAECDSRLSPPSKFLWNLQ
jgi:hypothetical protein